MPWSTIAGVLLFGAWLVASAVAGLRYWNGTNEVERFRIGRWK